MMNQTHSQTSRTPFLIYTIKIKRKIACWNRDGHGRKIAKFNNTI